MGTHVQLTIEGRPEDEITTISLWDIARNYRVQITAAENLNLGQVESLFVEASLFHGGIPLCPTLRTHQVLATRNPRWGAWLNFDIPCYNLPRCARLCITVWGRWNAGNILKDGTLEKSKKSKVDKDNDIIPLGWVNMTVLDFKGYLKTGRLKINLWPNEKANPIGIFDCIFFILL